MVSLELDFYLKPVSWNNCILPIYNQRRIIRTNIYHNYRKALHEKMNTVYKKRIISFCDLFDRSMCLTAEYIFSFPEAELFTKKGELKLRSNDVANFEKPLTDCIFKNFQDKGFNLDDSLIVSLNMKKDVAERHKIRVRLLKHTSTYINTHVKNKAA